MGGARGAGSGTQADRVNMGAKPPIRLGPARDPDERRALMAVRYLAGETLDAIGADFGLTRERVRQILEPLQIKRPTQKQRGKPFDPTDPKWRHAEGRSMSQAAWVDRSVAAMRANHERREEWVAWLTLFAARLGRSPKLVELQPEFGMAWQTIAMKFVGRTGGNRKGRSGQRIGLRRWFRLAGLAVRAVGGGSGRPKSDDTLPCQRCGMNEWRRYPSMNCRRCAECERRRRRNRKANAMVSSVGVLGIRRVG